MALDCGLVRAGLLSGVAMIALQAGPASAADAGGGPSVAEVVVTAQRRAERLEDVPMSVSALTAESVQASGVVNIHDIGQIVPGAQINNTGYYTQPVIRGVTTLTAGNGYENNVAIYLDGFYSPDMVTIDQDLVNIDSVQVLKGPQGTLWGRNATGGAILINTKAPSKVFTGKIEARYARFDDKILSAYVSGPITDRVRFSVAGYGRSGDGYNKMLDTSGRVIGDASPVRRASVRAKLEIDLADNLVATLGYNFGQVRDFKGGMYNIWRFPSPALPKPPARADQPFTFSNNRPTDNLSITSEGTLKLAYTTPIGVLTSYTGYAERRSKVIFDFDASWLDLTFGNQRWNQGTFQQALDYNIDQIEHLDLVVGASYYRDAIKNRYGYSFANFALQSAQYQTLTKQAYAAYGDATYHLTDRLALNLGARYTREKDLSRYALQLASGAFSFPWQQYSKTFSAFTPRASIRYEIAPRTNVYASYSRGFRSGGFQASVSATSSIPFRPEKITAYEVGFKTAQSRFRFEAAAFYYDYRDLQVAQTVPNPACTSPAGCAPINLVSNAPKAEIYGAEATVSEELVERLNINAGVSLLHARYKDFANATATGWNAATGLNVTGQVQDWSGYQMTRAPDFTFNLGAQYEIPEVAGGVLKLAANASYTSSFVVQNPSLWGPLAGAALADKQRYRQKAYALVNAQVNWTDASERYEVGVFGANLGNKKYFLTYSGSSFGDWESFQSPRTYGVRLGYNW
jgi:iron complex outermembrane receptor protein